MVSKRHAKGLLVQAVCVLAWACGESAVLPDRRVVAVGTSRDSVYLDVGDSALVQAEARDATGDVILEATIDWRTLDAGVATVVPDGRTARVMATGAGNGGIVASAGGHSATISVTVLPPITTTTLALHADTAWALGDEFVVGVTSQSASGARVGRYTAVSRSNVVWTWFDDQAHAVRAFAQLPGETYVVVAERKGTNDSVLIVVRQRPAHVTIAPRPLGGFLGRGLAVTASVADSRHNPIPAQSVVWTSVDTTIARVDSTGFVSFDGVGTTAIVATHATGLTDSAQVTVLPYPKLFMWNIAVGHSHDTLTVGMHQLSDSFYASAEDPVSPWVHLRIIDTSIATAPDSVLYVGGGGTFRVHGRRPGRTLLIGEAPLIASDSVHIHVVPARLAVVDPLDLLPLAIKGTDNVHFGVTTLDSLGTPHPIADTLKVAFRSSDSTIIDLFQTPDTFTLVPPGGPSMTVFSAHALDTGTAVIRATAADYAPDSMVWRVLAGPKLRFVQGGSQMLGAGQRASGGIVTVGPLPPGDTIMVTFSQRHPATVSLPSSLTLTGFTGTGLYGTYTMDALLPGTDTIIATAAGHEPDTAIITVTTPRILFPDTVQGTILGGAGAVLVGDSLGTPHPPTQELLLLAISNDTAVVGDTWIRIPQYVNVNWLVFPATDTGVATVTVRDSAALYPPKLVTVIVTIDSSLHVVTSDGSQFGPAATGQRFEDGRFRLRHPQIPDPGRAVRLSTTVPGVLRVPDSVIIRFSDYTLFPGVAGDTAGTTRIVATAHGFRPDTSGPIAVGQGHLSLQAPDTVFVGGTGYSAIVAALSPKGVPLPMDQNLDVALVPLDSGIAPTNSTIPAGLSGSPPTSLEFSAPGTLRLGALDQRPVPTPFEGDTVTIVARLPWLLAGAPSTGPPMTVGVGQRLSAIIARPGNTVSGAAVVSVAHRGSHTISSPSAVLPAGTSSVPYSIEARTIGVDTLLLAATGYQSGSATVTVTDGRVQILGWPGLLVVGDSVPIQLQVLDSLSLTHSVVARTTFAMQISGGLTFSNGAQPISSISVAADSVITARFYVKATSAGPGEVLFVNLNYLPRAFQINVVNRPLAASPQ